MWRELRGTSKTSTAPQSGKWRSAWRDCLSGRIKRAGLSRSARRWSGKAGTGGGDLLDVAMVGAAAAAHHVEPREALLSAAYSIPSSAGLPESSVGRLVQFRVAHPRRVRAKSADSVQPRLARGRRRCSKWVGWAQLIM